MYTVNFPTIFKHPHYIYMYIDKLSNLINMFFFSHSFGNITIVNLKKSKRERDKNMQMYQRKKKNHFLQKCSNRKIVIITTEMKQKYNKNK